MAKTTAPLLGFGATGQIGKSQVYATWRGVSYARRHVVPANPQTTEQTKTRSAFTYLSNVYKMGGTELKAPWKAFAQGKPMTDRNALIGVNTKTFRTDSTLVNMLLSPGANGGLVAGSMTTHTGSGTCTIDLAEPTLPTGWTIDKAVVVLLKDEDPKVATSFLSYPGTDLTTPFNVTIAGQPAATYRAFGWFVYTKPDKTKAYGPSINATVVVS